MVTVCVGCGLEVDGEGRIALDTAASELHMEASYINRDGFSIPTDYDSVAGPDLILLPTNPSECRTMILRASIESTVKLGWDAGTEYLTVFPEFSINAGASYTEGGQVGFAGPPQAFGEGRYVSVPFQRQVATLLPGASLDVRMRLRVRAENTVTATISDMDLIFTLDGLYLPA